MRQPRINDSVRLTQGIPELSLDKGETGVVRSTWFAPAISYEVEFHPLGQDYQTRCLVGAEQLELSDAASGESSADSSDASASPRVHIF